MPFKFCPECGAAVEPGASFCGSCGAPLAQAPAKATPLPVVGIVSLVTLLVLGGGFWLYFRLAPEAPRPLKPGERAPGVMANAPAAPPAGAPGANHPPLELPDDIKAFMADLQAKAEAAPDDAEKWAQLAGVYYRASRLDPSYTAKAQAAYEHLLERDEKNLDALRGLGNLAYDAKDRPGAISFYERYLAISPDDPEVRTDLGTMHYENGNPEKAIAEYDRVIAEKPDFYQAYFNLAVVHDAAGDRTASHAALEKARATTTEENVKQRITALLDIAKERDLSLADAAATLQAQAAPPGGMPASGSPPAAAAAPKADSFEGAVEQLFRGHRIAGPKVVSIEWPEPNRARVLMANFPMEQMPEVMKIGYLGKMSDGIKAAQEKFEKSGTIVVELVDQPTGKVMATVDPSQPQGS